MTAPRQIVPGTTYLVTRRCSERRMFMRPSEEVNELLRYILAVSVERFGILLHAYCFMSNHVHMVLTDPLGVLPAFEQYMGSLIARSCNALLQRRQYFWEPGSYNAVKLIEDRDTEDKIAYTLANPVSAGLIRDSSAWPGLHSSLEAIDGPAIVAHRPDLFFRRDGAMPATASLKVVAPPGIESLEDFRQRIQDEVARRASQAAEKVASEGRTFLGVQGIAAQSPFAAPAREEPPRRLEPRVACLDPGKRREALERLKVFVRAYREAWGQFASGVRETIFPHGTYWMRVAYGLPCAAAG